MLYHRFLSIALLISVPSLATELDTVVVSSGDDSSLADVAQPALVIDKQALNENPGGNLGTLLEQQPGISNASFGPGVGRPVLRGMSGSRVKMMLNGHDSADLSAMSSDHAPMAEAANAQQVEVLQGPATLMYGGGAIGGVVNVLDDKIADKPLHGTSGQASAKISSNNSARELGAELNSGNGVFAWHLDAFDKKAEDYSAGKGRKVKNSDSKAKGGSVGVSWTPEAKGYLGLSISRLEYDYGVPNDKNSPTRVRPEQTRYDLKSSWLNPLPGIVSWQNELSFNDYEHDELTLPTVEGLFDQETWEFNSRLRHQPLLGWRGNLGVHFSRKEMKLCHDHNGCSRIPDYSDQTWDGSKGGLFTSLGGFEFVHDTPIPQNTTQDIGYFLVEKKPWDLGEFGSGLLELGARIDFRTISMDEKTVRPSSRQHKSYYDDKYFAPLTLSLASTWQITEQQRFAISIARAQRAPEAQELFWNGDHHATFSYQLDNPDLKEETAYTLDVNWMFNSNDWMSRIALYRYQFDNYIYNDLKAVKDPFHKHAVYRHEQKDARFYGGEAQLEYALNEQIFVTAQGDYVAAQLTKANSDGNKNLPRTPPATVLLRLDWKDQRWSAFAENKWLVAQRKTATTETESNPYQLFNLGLNYSADFAGGYEWSAALQANNVFDVFGRNHVSYLKQFAPVSGRNISLHTSLQF